MQSLWLWRAKDGILAVLESFSCRRETISTTTIATNRGTMRRRHGSSQGCSSSFHLTFCIHFKQPNQVTYKWGILALFLALLAWFPIKLETAAEGGSGKRIRGVLTTLEGRHL